MEKLTTLEDQTEYKGADDKKGAFGDKEEREKQNASEQISLQHIMELREAFDAAKKHREGNLTIEEFVKAFGGIIGKDMNDKQINQLFMKIDADSNGTVDWDEFMNYMLLENETLSSMKAEHFEYIRLNPPNTTYAHFDPPPNKDKECHADMITCIYVWMPDEDYSMDTLEIDDGTGKQGDAKKTEVRKTIQYITSSRDGRVKIWNAKTLRADKTINVSKYWVNCIQYMTKSQILVAACADRSLKFYDISLTNVNTPVSIISELDGLPLCMDYFTKSKQGLETLVVGDDLGICHMYDFKHDWHSCEWKIKTNDDTCCHIKEIKEAIGIIEDDPKDKNAAAKSLTSSKAKEVGKKKSKGKPKVSKEKSKNYVVKTLKGKSQSKQYMRNINVTEVQFHKGWITKIKYIEDLNYILTSSFDGFCHFHDVDTLQYKDRTFSLHQKGVNSFVYSERHRFVASCGEERHIIMWDPFTRRSIYHLTGHNTSVHDLAINDDRHHLISLGTDKTIIIWDIRTYKKVQTIFDKIPYRPEDRLTCIEFDRINNNILLGSRKINRWNFKTQEEIKTSHEFPISIALYNQNFEQVVSCDDGGFIAVWDIENGKLMSKFGNAHGGIFPKITSACFDGSQRRLVTSGADGSIKVWNFSNGQEITRCEQSEKEKEESAKNPNRKDMKKRLTKKSSRNNFKNSNEITDLCFVFDPNNANMTMGYVLAVGWNKKIYCYLDEKEDIVNESNVMPPSDQGIRHDDDIMVVTYSAQDNLVFTGSHEGKVIAWNFETKRAKHELHSEDDTCVSNEPAKDAKSVDCLLVLEKSRTLVSGSADQYLRFWDNKTLKLRNKVKVNHHPEDALTALATDKDNTVLFTGDTSGCVKKFNLSDFNIDESSELPKEWFIKAHKSIINSIAVAELDKLDDKFIVTSSDDRNIKLHRFDGMFIGQFGQEAEWNIHNTHLHDEYRIRNDTEVKTYDTYAHRDKIKADENNAEYEEKKLEKDVSSKDKSGDN
jgi:WD40 repeat protein